MRDSKNSKNMLLLNLTKDEIQRLNYQRYYYPCPIVQKRLHALYLKGTTKMSNTQIGALVGLHRDTVGDWSSCYKQEGYESVCCVRYGTNKSVLDDYKESLLTSFSKNPPMTSNEAKARIETLTGISRSPTQVRNFMKSHKMRYLQTGHIPAKANGEKQKEWVKSILEPAIEQAKNGECQLLFLDAAHFILQPFICALWCFKRLFIKASAGRNRINVLGAVNAITKEIHIMHNTTYINAQTIISFFALLRETYCTIPLKLVLDNARYQHCKIVEQAAESMGITLLFLPSYSPNLNIIERLWKFTKKKILYAKYYETPAKFHDAIIGFFKTINSKYTTELKSLLTLKFQFFDTLGEEIYPV